MDRWNRKSSSKGKGFQQPKSPHSHWHIDIAYLNIRGTFYHLISVLDGYSRYIVHWEIRENMKEHDVEVVLQRAREKFPDKTPRIISDNGPRPTQHPCWSVPGRQRVQTVHSHQRHDACADVALLSANGR